MTRWDIERAVQASDLPSPARHIMHVLLSRTETKTAAIPAEHTPSLTILAAATGTTAPQSPGCSTGSSETVG